MLAIRKASDRGHFDHGWLDTYHTFSFGDYYDPRHTRFRTLRVMNEDRVQPGRGFGMHGHQEMEIISYVLEGSLQHRDSLGNGSVIRPGELQRMSAGTGILHSEFNPSDRETVHFYQIWLLPALAGLAPAYEQMSIPEEEKEGRLRLVASDQGGPAALKIHQDVRVYLSTLQAGSRIEHEIAPGRHVWLQVLRGGVLLNGQLLSESDGAALSDEKGIAIEGRARSEIMLFDLA